MLLQFYESYKNPQISGSLFFSHIIRNIDFTRSKRRFSIKSGLTIANWIVLSVDRNGILGA